MVSIGKKRRFNEELAGWRNAQDQQATVEGPPFQPQPSRFDEVDSSDFVALPEKHLVSGERSLFKRLLVQRQKAAGHCRVSRHHDLMGHEYCVDQLSAGDVGTLTETTLMRRVGASDERLAI
jgi:hypothetical protein